MLVTVHAIKFSLVESNVLVISLMLYSFYPCILTAMGCLSLQGDLV